MFQQKAKILLHKEIGPNCFLLKLSTLDISRVALPGQFVHLKVNGLNSPLLRRPFSLHRIYPEIIEILYQIKGKGTQLLARKKKNEMIDLIGPLGNGFDLKSNFLDKVTVLVAGGIGIAPLFALADALIKRQTRKELYFLVGARSKDLIFRKEEIENLGVKVFYATDDGSFGKKGLVTQLFAELLKTELKNLGRVFACGPKLMLKEMQNLTRQFGFSCQISLEENMACGVGACFGCAVPVKKGRTFEYKRVCKDGPIFEAQEVIF